MTDTPIDAGNNINQLPPKKDVPLVITTIILVAVLFLIETYMWYEGVSNVYIFLFGLSALILLVCALWVGIKYILQRNYKSALPVFLFVPVLIFSFATPSRIFSPAHDDANFGFAHDLAYHIKLASNEKQYFEEIKLDQPNSKGFRYAKFIWYGRYGDGNETVLVYDESDELGLPQPRGYTSDCPYLVYELKSHFYVVRVRCG